LESTPVISISDSTALFGIRSHWASVQTELAPKGLGHDEDNNILLTVYSAQFQT